jgi:hypothetical protein
LIWLKFIYMARFMQTACVRRMKRMRRGNEWRPGSEASPSGRRSIAARNPAAHMKEPIAAIRRALGVFGSCRRLKTRENSRKGNCLPSLPAKRGGCRK